ncbi:S-layer homology domain-containing protein [Paenibacillus sp. WQ 127069]|uniref:S-layer homology domain-containing protein n=1 Tax=Paenibacillus baimaensis TaxID=2982185 RepID=A0ABT2UG33_9BACL|nr:S-layer homology domain-containing protein [Paenibacillus sp. WQ 127069]MCU6793594.1 S-layer homology domain-containing protein [Paenibacillus sp. WQ 127069]
MKKIVTLVSTAALLCTVSAGSVFAFSDLNAAEKEPIMMLKDKGIVTGVDSEHFAPRNTMSYAQSISLIVKALDINLNAVSFVKQPQASDFFTTIPNDAWYAEAFINAKVNGLDIAKDVDPNAAITREKYANLLVTALELKGTFPMVKMMVLFDDNDQIDPMYQGTLQRLYLYRIAKADESRMAYPKREMTRGEAAVWVGNTVKFLESQPDFMQPVKPAPDQQDDVKMTVEQVNADVNKVTLTRSLPSPGYGFTISGIRFQPDGTAVIQYQVSDPKPGMMYPQVITEGKAETYISSKYKPVTEREAAPTIAIDPPAPAAVNPNPS